MITRTQLVNAYTEHGNVTDTAAALGADPAAVAKRLAGAGIEVGTGYLNDDQKARLKGDYPFYVAIRRVPDLAASMGLSVASLRAQVAALGLDQGSGDLRWSSASETALTAVLDHFASCTSLGLTQYAAKYGIPGPGMRSALSGLVPQRWEAVMASKQRKNRGASLGRDTEHRMRDMLSKAGWVLMRSAGSRGAVDLAALKPGVVLFIQVKRSGVLGPAGWNALMDSAEKAGAIPVMAENPWPGCWRLWRLTERKVSRGPEPKIPLELEDVVLL